MSKISTVFDSIEEPGSTPLTVLKPKSEGVLSSITGGCEGVLVGVGVGVDVGLGEGTEVGSGVGSEDPPPPPHAAKNTITALITPRVTHNRHQFFIFALH